MTPGVRTRFARELDRLNQDALRLGSGARQAVARAMTALETDDGQLARELIAADVEINTLRFEIERRCYALIATEQPVAGDLRLIVAVLIVTTELERIADHGKKIARICLRLLDSPHPVPITNLSRLSELALEMLDRALHAFASMDQAEAVALCKADDHVDAYYKQTFNILLTYMLEDPSTIGAATQLLQAAHELERIGDRATNIGERVIYAVSGQLSDLNT